MTNVLDILEERGYIEQMTHEQEMKELFAKECVPFYIGFDPTADSLHVEIGRASCRERVYVLV